MNDAKNERDILGLCAGKLPKYKMPSKIHFVKALPKSANAKIDRGKCRELIPEEMEVSPEGSGLQRAL